MTEKANKRQVPLIVNLKAAIIKPSKLKSDVWNILEGLFWVSALVCLPLVGMLSVIWHVLPFALPILLPLLPVWYLFHGMWLLLPIIGPLAVLLLPVSAAPLAFAILYDGGHFQKEGDALMKRLFQL